jgi:hypothetical protein
MVAHATVVLVTSIVGDREGLSRSGKSPLVVNA